MNEQTCLLFAQPSFLAGAARTLDLGCTFTQYNTLPSPEEADAAALHSDWAAVGDDLRQAMAQFAASMSQQAAGVQHEEIERRVAERQT